MKHPLVTVVTVIATVLVALAQAQVTRVVALPFQATGPAAPYAAGLTAALQRSLNVIDGVFVPPVGDALLVTQRLQTQDALTPEGVATAFGAQIVIGGEVSASGEAARIQVALAGAGFDETPVLELTAPLNNPAQLVETVVTSIIAEVGLTLGSQDRQQLASVVAQTPSLPSLSAVANASLRAQLPNLSELETAAQLDAGSSWVVSEHARALALSGDAEGALAISLQAIELDPNDVEALIVRSIILLESGDSATALQGFEAALVLNPQHALALVGRGRILAQDEARRDEATQSLEAALAAYPRLVDAYLELASLQDRDSPQQALQTLRRGGETVPESDALHSAVIQQAQRLGDAAGALAYLRQVLARVPESPPTVYALARTLPDEYQPQTLAILQQGRERYPNNSRLAIALAQQLHDDPAAAAATLQEVLDANPGNPELLNELAILQARQGDLEAARTTLEGIEGQNFTVQLNLAQVYLQAGQSQAAVNTLQPLLSQAPSDAELYTLYGVALGRTGAVDQARTALEQALALDPEAAGAQEALSALEQLQGLTGGQQIELSDDAAAAFQAGQAALQEGDNERALTEFTRARELQDSGLIAFYQGYAEQRVGQHRQAIANYERALQELPDNATVLNNLGFAYLQVGRFDRALSTLEGALAADEGNATAQLNLGLTYFALERYQQAIAPLERAVSLDPALEGDVGAILEAARERAQ